MTAAQLAPQPWRCRTVAVIGGGLAGTTAALAAADRGARVVLLERQRWLGGLATSFDRGGWTLDNGQHVFLRCCTAYRGHLDRIGASGLAVLQPRLDIPVLVAHEGGVTRSRLRRSARPVPSPLHLAGALSAYSALSVRERLSAARTAAAMSRLDPQDPGVDRISVGAWLDARGIGAAERAAMWELLLLGTLNLRLDEASLALAVTVLRTGLLAAPDSGDVGRAIAPLAHLHDRAARRALEAAGVEIRTGTAVHGLGSGELTRWRVATDGGPVEADAVVVATPPAAAAGLLATAPSADAPAAAARAVAALGSSPIVNVHVRLDREVLTDPFAAVVGSPLQWVFRTEPRTLAVSLSAADTELTQPAAALRAMVVHELARVLLAARGARVLDVAVTRERAATPRFGPGSAQLRPAQATGVPGLALAGAWTDTGWPATLEGAVRSGAAAVEALGALIPARQRVSAAPRPAAEVAA